MKQLFSALLIAIAGAASACTSADATTSPSTTSTAATTTETFSGSIAQTANATYPFTVATTGSLQVSLTSVAPLSTMALGVAVTTGGASCGSAIAKNDNARTGTPALGGVVTAGSYCVQVYDSGNIPDSSSATYTVQVTHP